MEDPSWTNLAEAVRKRRLELGLTVTSTAGNAGINRATWATLEKGTHKLSERLWSSVEQTLAWAPGSINDVIHGGEPTPTTTTHQGAASATLGPLMVSATGVASRPDGFDLAAEVDRIKALDIPASTKIKLVQAMVELYEQQQHERAAETRS